MTLDDVPPDVTVVLTDELVRLFKAAGCSPPKCHACYQEIKVGDRFKLAAHEARDVDVMLCDIHTIEDLIKEEQRVDRLNERYREARKELGYGGGFSRPSLGKRK